MKQAIFIFSLFVITLGTPLIAISQSIPKIKPPSWVGIPIGSTKEGVSEKLLGEYSSIVSKYKHEGNRWWVKFEKSISKEDRERLEQIFKQMNTGQQAKQQVAFVKMNPPLKKRVPSIKEFDAWKNASIYGIWIDGKKVANAILDNYKNDDFDQVSIYKLYGAAKRNKKYSYQVDLMTKDYYQNYYEQAMAKRNSRIVFRDL